MFGVKNTIMNCGIVKPKKYLTMKIIVLSIKLYFTLRRRCLIKKRLSSLNHKPEGWLTIGQLAKKIDINRSTIHYYVKMRLLPKPKKINRNMAYYPPESIERLLLIKNLQEKRFLPLNVVKRILTDSGIEGIKYIDQAVLGTFVVGKTYERDRILKMYPIGKKTIAELVNMGILPRTDRFSEDDVKIISYIFKIGEAGLNEGLGFSISSLRIYLDTLNVLIDEEFRIFNKNVLGKMSPDKVVTLVNSVITPISSFLDSLHKRMILERLKQAGINDQGVNIISSEQ